MRAFRRSAAARISGSRSRAAGNCCRPLASVPPVAAGQSVLFPVSARGPQARASQSAGRSGCGLRVRASGCRLRVRGSGFFSQATIFGVEPRAGRAGTRSLKPPTHPRTGTRARTHTGVCVRELLTEHHGPGWLPLSLSLSISLSLSPSPTFSLPLSLSLCLSIYLPPPPLSRCYTHTQKHMQACDPSFNGDHLSLHTHTNTQNREQERPTRTHTGLVVWLNEGRSFFTVVKVGRL